jgi:NarL family two-component system sensor histidine kinase LiaS
LRLSHAVQDAPAEKRFVYEFHCDEAIEERSDLSPSVQMQIYRIVQEAVNNIWRHAEATEVKMFVTSSPAETFSLRSKTMDGRLRRNTTNARAGTREYARARRVDRCAHRVGRTRGRRTVFTLTRTPVVEGLSRFDE